MVRVHLLDEHGLPVDVEPDPSVALRPCAAEPPQMHPPTTATPSHARTAQHSGSENTRRACGGHAVVADARQGGDRGRCTVFPFQNRYISPTGIFQVGQYFLRVARDEGVPAIRAWISETVHPFCGSPLIFQRRREQEGGNVTDVPRNPRKYTHARARACSSAETALHSVLLPFWRANHLVSVHY